MSSRGVALAWLACASVGGCRQVLGVDGYGTEGNYTTLCDGVSYRSQGCRDCVASSCCDEAAACAADPACAALATCLGRCLPDDHACRGKCGLSIPDTAAMRALSTCEATANGEDCRQCAGRRAVWSGGECDACLSDKCGADLDAFSRDRAALDARACELACPSVKLLGDCGCAGGEDAGQDGSLPDPLRTCAEGRCASVCDPSVAPPDWSCLGSVQWPKPAVARVELRLHLVRVATTGIPVPEGVRVSACSDLSDCNPTLGTTTTTADGWAVLGLGRQVTSGNFLGYLSAVEADDAANGIDALLYLFPRLREARSFRQVRMVSHAVADLSVGKLSPASGPPLTLDWANTGGIVWSVVSCNRAAAEGVTVSLPSGERPYYLPADGDVPSLVPVATSRQGLGIILNVAHGPVDLTARTGDQIVGVYPIQVQRGRITHVTLVPAPSR